MAAHPAQNPFRLFLTVVVGLVSGMAIGAATEYCTSSAYYPVQVWCTSPSFVAISLVDLCSGHPLYDSLVVCGYSLIYQSSPAFQPQALFRDQRFIS